MRNRPWRSRDLNNPSFMDFFLYFFALYIGICFAYFLYEVFCRKTEIAMKRIFLIVTAIWLLPLGALAQEKGEPQPFDDFLRQSEKSIEQSLASLQKTQEEWKAAAEEVQKAQQEMDQSTGFLAPILAQERQRKTRQRHHELSQKMKDERREFGRLMRQVIQRIVQENAPLQQEIDSLEEQLAASAGSDAKALSRRMKELQDRKQANQDLVEKHLGRFAQEIRQIRQQAEEEFRMMPPPPGAEGPPFFDPDLAMGPPPGDEDSPRRHWPFFDKFREWDEATQRRIEALEQQVEELKARVQELESRQGKAR